MRVCHTNTAHVAVTAAAAAARQCPARVTVKYVGCACCLQGCVACGSHAWRRSVLAKPLPKLCAQDVRVLVSQLSGKCLLLLTRASYCCNPLPQPAVRVDAWVTGCGTGVQQQLHPHPSRPHNHPSVLILHSACPPTMTNPQHCCRSSPPRGAKTLNPGRTNPASTGATQQQASLLQLLGRLAVHRESASCQLPGAGWPASRPACPAAAEPRASAALVSPWLPRLQLGRQPPRTAHQPPARGRAAGIRRRSACPARGYPTKQVAPGKAPT